MNDQEQEFLEITLLGRDYRVACAPEERESLMAAVVYVDEKMRDIADKTKSAGERVAVMAALNIAHELLTLRLPGGFDVHEFKRRIGNMQTRIDAVITSQEPLF